MGDKTGVDESIGDVLGEDSDVLMVGAEIVAAFVICPVDLHNRFVGSVPVVVDVKFFFLIQFVIVANHMLLGQMTHFVLVDLVPVVLAYEVPLEAWEGVHTATHQ